MAKFCGGTDFKILHHNFISGDISGKIFMTKDYQTDSIHWGKGLIVDLHKADPFLLNIILDWSFDNPNGFIGDIELFYNLVNINEEQYIHKRIRKSHTNFKKRTKRMLSLHNILRKHKPHTQKESEKISA